MVMMMMMMMIMMMMTTMIMVMMIMMMMAMSLFKYVCFILSRLIGDTNKKIKCGKIDNSKTYQNCL